MKKNQKRIMTGVISAAGAVVAYYGVRRLLDWRQQRQFEGQHQDSFQRRMQSLMTDSQGTQFQESRSSGEGVPVQGTRYQPHTQPDRQPIQPIPMTGVAAPDLEEMTRTLSEDTQAEVNELAGILVQYLMSFHGMISLLRSRRSQNQPGPGARTLGPNDRDNFQETLDRLEEELPDYAEGNLENGSIQERLYRLTGKVRNALRNLELNDDDLFRINGEVRTEACKVLAEVDSGMGSTDLDLARQMFECG